MSKKLIFIAEAGVNHNGSLKKAKKLVDGAAFAGADYVKFQTYNVDDLIALDTPKANYQMKNTKSKSSQYSMLENIQMSYENHFILKNYAKKKGIKFLSSAFDIKSLRFLNNLKLDYIKIPSGEIDNTPYLENVGSINRNTILSTGMSSIKEIRNACNVLSSSGLDKKKLTILQCNTEYPSPLIDANISAMLTIKRIFKTNVGYSDHTLGSEAIYAAVSLGAQIIEKHFTLNKKDKGPDHSSSASVEELRNIIQTSRKILVAIGNNKKEPTRSELKNLNIIRKKIVSSKDIKKGQIFSENNIKPLRSKKGISVQYWNKILGKKSKNNYKKNQPISD